MRRSGRSVLPVPIYVTHQSLERHAGGASAVTAWVLQALCLDFNVLLATPDPVVDFKRIDHAYGTSLASAPVGLHRLPVPPWLHHVPEGKLKSLRLAATFRDPVLHRRDGRLIFNTANEMGFLGRSVNYVHCPIRHPRMIAELYQGRERWLRLANNAAFKTVSSFDEEGFRRSVCVANSRWTASALRRTYGLEARVVYPPVTVPIPSPLPLVDRSPGFVCIGRITADKRTSEAIELMDELRGKGHDVHLHIVGNGGDRYARRIEAAVRCRPYVTLHRDLSRIKLAALLNEHRFGLHMMRNEHFGMAVAEMAAAGMLVLAHRSAGPVEILGAGCPLLFADAQEAAEVAGRLLDNPSLQAELQAETAGRRVHETFHPEAFMRAIRQVVAEALH